MLTKTTKYTQALFLILSSYQVGLGPTCGISPGQIEAIGLHGFNIDFYNLPGVALLAEMEADAGWIRAGTAHMPHPTQCDWQLVKHQALHQLCCNRARLQVPQPCPTIEMDF